MRRALLVGTIALLAAHSLQAAPKTHRLEVSPGTVAYGYYWSEAQPVLRIASGDIVDVDTMLTNTPQGLQRAGVPEEKIQASLRAVVDEVTGERKGPGGHILTGPIYVEGAEPGDVLAVEIKAIRLAIPYAYNAFSPGRGFLPEDFPYARMRIVPLDERRGVAHFADGIEVPLRPFFGSIGVAPPEISGRVSSGPPWVHAGNLDNKELVAGSTLYIPVAVPGALLSMGDGHAMQGDGEVTLTALETSLRGTVQISVRKGMSLRWPRAETPTHYIAMGLHTDLDEAAKLATREMIDFLVAEKKMNRDEAYVLCSVAADLHVTQLVDGTKGVHAMLAKSIFSR